MYVPPYDAVLRQHRHLARGAGHRRGDGPGAAVPLPAADRGGEWRLQRGGLPCRQPRRGRCGEVGRDRERAAALCRLRLLRGPPGRDARRGRALVPARPIPMSARPCGPASSPPRPSISPWSARARAAARASATRRTRSSGRRRCARRDTASPRHGCAAGQGGPCRAPALSPAPAGRDQVHTFHGRKMMQGDPAPGVRISAPNQRVCFWGAPAHPAAAAAACAAARGDGREHRQHDDRPRAVPWLDAAEKAYHPGFGADPAGTAARALRHGLRAGVELRGHVGGPCRPCRATSRARGCRSSASAWAPRCCPGEGPRAAAGHRALPAAGVGAQRVDRRARQLHGRGAVGPRHPQHQHRRLPLPPRARSEALERLATARRRSTRLRSASRTMSAGTRCIPRRCALGERTVPAHAGRERLLCAAERAAGNRPACRDGGGGRGRSRASARSRSREPSTCIRSRRDLQLPRSRVRVFFAVDDWMGCCATM